MEVAVGLDSAVERDHWVVYRRRQFDQRDSLGMINCVAHCTGHLWGAAQRVGVLNPGAGLGTVALPDLTAGHDPAQVAGRSSLTGMRPQSVQIVCEDVVGAEQTFHAHGCRDVCHLEQPPQIDDREHQHAEHAVGAIDQGQALLLGKRDGGDASGSECIAALE